MDNMGNSVDHMELHRVSINGSANLLEPNGPGLGIALFLKDFKLAFCLGTLNDCTNWDPHVSGQLFKLLSSQKQEFRDNVLRDSIVTLSIRIPTYGNQNGIYEQNSFSHSKTTILNEDSSIREKSTRRFKPLFYHQSSLYCTAMPAYMSTEESSPGDGLVIRPTKLGLLLLHVGDHTPPAVIINTLEKFLPLYDI